MYFLVETFLQNVNILDLLLNLFGILSLLNLVLGKHLVKTATVLTMIDTASVCACFPIKYVLLIL